MKKLQYIVLIIVSLIIFCGCSGESKKSYTNKDGHEIVDLMYPNGMLKSKTIYLKGNDDYIFAEYFDDGLLKDTMHIVNGQAEGIRIFHDRSAGLKHTEHYLHGILDGSHHANYNNGVSSFEGYRLNGAMVGEWIFHYPDGKPITYEFYDSTGHLQFLEKYGSQGDVLSTEGNGLIICSLSLLNVSANDTIFAEALIAMPPASKVNLDFQTKLANGQNTILYSGEMHQLLSRIPFVLNQEGNYTIDFNLNIAEGKSGKSQLYVKRIMLNVK